MYALHANRLHKTNVNSVSQSGIANPSVVVDWLFYMILWLFDRTNDSPKGMILSDAPMKGIKDGK